MSTVLSSTKLLESMQAGNRITLVCPLSDTAEVEPRFVVNHRGTPSRMDISDGPALCHQAGAIVHLCRHPDRT